MSSPEFAWLVEHDREIVEKYRGQWIAVWQGEVVGVGSTALEAAAQAEARVGDVDYVLEAVDWNTDVIYVGT